MTYPSASTPNQAIHQIANSSRNQLAFTAQELSAIGQSLLQGFVQQITQAILGVATGSLPELKSLLSAWAADPADIIATSIAALGGTGTGLPGLTSALEAVAAGAEGLGTLLADMEIATVADLATALNTAITDSTNSAEYWSTLFADLEIAGVADLAALVEGIIDGSDLTWLQTLLTDLGLGAISDLSTYLALSNTFVTDLLAAIPGETEATIATAIATAITASSNATTFLNELVTDLSAGNLVAAADLVGQAATLVVELLVALPALTVAEIATLLANVGGFYNGLLSDLGAANLSALLSVITTAVSNASTFATFETNLLSDMSQANLAAVATVLGTATSEISNFVTGLGALSANPAGALLAALNTFAGGTALSTVFTNITPSTGAINAAGLGGAINIAATLRGVALSTLFGATGNFTGVLDSTATLASGIGSLALSSIFGSGGNFIGTLDNTATFGSHALSTVLSNITASTGALAAAGLTGAINPAVTFLVGASNVALSTLLANLNSSGLFDASQLANIANVPAIALAKITGLTGYLTNITSGGVWSGALTSTATVGGTAITTLLGNLTAAGLLGTNILNQLNTAGTILGSAITNIPNANVIGQIGSTIGVDITGLSGVLGNLFASIFGVTAPTTYAGMNNYVGPTALQLDTASTLSNAAAVALAAQAISNPSSWGVDPTASPVFNISTLAGTTATTVSVTSGASVIGFIGAPNATTKKSIAFLGYTSSAITVVLNLYSVNTTTGALTFQFSSGNISLTTTGSTPLWNYYDFTTPQIFTTPTIASLAGSQAVQTDWYAVEMYVVGTGTYNLVGIPNHWLPANTSSPFPQQLGATRGPGTVAYDALGSAYTHTTSASTMSGTLTHTATAGASVLLGVYTAMSSGGTPGSWTRTATYGGVSMTSLGAITIGSQGWVEYFGLNNVAGGAKTVAFSATGGSGTFLIVAANTVSYTGVDHFGTAVTNSGASTSITSGTVTSATGQMVAELIGVVNGNGTSFTLTSFNHTSRYGPTILSDSYYGGILIGDAPGASSVSFSVTDNGSWGFASIAVPLIPGVPAGTNIAAPGPTGSANVPWFALCGSAGISEQAPLTDSFLTAGSGQTYTPPVWAQQTVDAGGTIYFDLVAVGAGGSGEVKSSNTFAGYGGNPGNWNTSRLTYGAGSTIPTTMSVTVGAGGASIGTTVGAGNDGGNSSVSGTGITTLTATGGVGGNSAIPQGESVGQGASPGNSSGPSGSPLGLTYTGGIGGEVYTSAGPAAGTAPGASGAGGEQASIGGGPWYSGAGAQGAVFITCYQ